MTNKERAELGEQIVTHARTLFGDHYASADTIIPDILADLMHACDQGDQMPPFDDCLREASMHHDAEVLEGDEAKCRKCGAPADNGEGWNGLCGNCADAVEPHDMTCDEIKAATPLPDFASPLPEPFLWQCDSCHRKYRSEQEMDVIKDIWERCQPGDMMPSGECPECHALCFPVEKKKTLWTIQYESDDGPQVDLAYCDHSPTLDDIFSAFEHLRLRNDEEGLLTADDFTCLPYSGIPTIYKNANEK